MHEDHDPFAGTWTMAPDRSAFDANHRPSEATLLFEREPDGYVMYAEGISGGKQIKEHPMHFVFDGKHHDVPGAPDMSAMSTRSDPKTIRVQVVRDNQVVGGGTYIVSEDGTTLTTTIKGMDKEQRSFETSVVWLRHSVA